MHRRPRIVAALVGLAVLVALLARYERDGAGARRHRRTRKKPSITYVYPIQDQVNDFYRPPTRARDWGLRRSDYAYQWLRCDNTGAQLQEKITNASGHAPTPVVTGRRDAHAPSRP